ncbi:hypothetical protein ACFU98_42435 [Streptomyces sp. NPDC057575]|uniref:hypothetical protein n=1 Tax=unclassified Streptomyces TaxID=2593676 RepID=UPI0036A38FE7
MLATKLVNEFVEAADEKGVVAEGDVFPANAESVEQDVERRIDVSLSSGPLRGTWGLSQNSRIRSFVRRLSWGLKRSGAVFDQRPPLARRIH